MMVVFLGEPGLALSRHDVGHCQQQATFDDIGTAWVSKGMLTRPCRPGFMIRNRLRAPRCGRGQGHHLGWLDPSRLGAAGLDESGFKEAAFATLPAACGRPALRIRIRIRIRIRTCDGIMMHMLGSAVRALGPAATVALRTHAGHGACCFRCPSPACRLAPWRAGAIPVRPVPAVRLGPPPDSGHETTTGQPRDPLSELPQQCEASPGGRTNDSHLWSLGA